MNEYLESQSRAAMPITNDSLKCKDCAFRDDKMPTAFCQRYPRDKGRKPNSVLLGGNCPGYKPKEETT